MLAHHHPTALFLLLATTTIASTTATLAFAPPFLGPAVLQHGAPTTVWGTGAKPGATVSIFLRDDSTAVATPTANAGGNWTATIPAQRVQWNVMLTAATVSAEVARTTVSFGVVILCSGQSNMGMPVVNKPGAFQADNGTAEVAAVGRYAGRISLLFVSQSRFHHVPSWSSAAARSLRQMSAVCWYTGRDLFDAMGAATPVGLIESAVGGSPIEYWLPPGANTCETDKPQCDNKLPDSIFFTDMMTQITPYGIGAIVWDQAERDTKCPVSLDRYPCMQEKLASEYRRHFRSPEAPFVAVQLPGYSGAVINGTGKYPGWITSEMVFRMRLQQEAGAMVSPNASVVATYDRSCAIPKDCPFGSVHNVDKVEIGARIARTLQRMLRVDGHATVTEGPRAVAVTVDRVGGNNAASFAVTVQFRGGTAPFVARGTKNCTTCCDAKAAMASGGTTLDFDATVDGKTWVNSTAAAVVGDRDGDGDGNANGNGGGTHVMFHVALPKAPVAIRYTAASIFPQCALFNQEGLPAMPFEMRVKAGVLGEEV